MSREGIFLKHNMLNVMKRKRTFFCLKESNITTPVVMLPIIRAERRTKAITLLV